MQALSRCAGGSVAGVPLFAILLLPAAVFAVSSAATVFQLMAEVPPITLASWRLQLTTLILAAGAAWQWRGLDGDTRQYSLRKAPMLAASGLFLAVHFGCWVWSLEHTSLTHSLLFVSCSPLLLAGWALLRRQPISSAEIFGTLLGVVGAAVLAFSAVSSSPDDAQPSLNEILNTTQPPRSPLASRLLLADSAGQEGAPASRQPQLSGDIAALIAALALVGYLQVGSALRQRMPVFVYACPVTGIAALSLAVVATATERAAAAAAGLDGPAFVLSYFAHRRYALLVTYLALVPGIVGHTGFNTLLRYMTPLTVALAFQLEPPVGALIGWAAGVESAPGWSTLLGGCVMLGATIVVTWASTRRQEQEKQGSNLSSNLNSNPNSNSKARSEGGLQLGTLGRGDGGGGGEGRGVEGDEEEGEGEGEGERVALLGGGGGGAGRRGGGG